MKSYWTAATVILLTAWPLSSQASFIALNQAQAEQPKASHPSDSSHTTQSEVASQEPASGAKSPVAAGTGTASTPDVAKPNNTYLLVELSSSLKAKKLKPGDKIKAEVSQDVVSHGKVIIPMETKLTGHVTEVRVRDAEHQESRLGIVFDRILLKRHDINFQGVVQAVSAPVVRRSRVDEPSQMLPPAIGTVTRSSGGSSSGGVVGAPPNTGAPLAGDLTPYQPQVEVKQSPMNNAGGGAAAAQLGVGKGAKPLSIGTPQGVTGIKGLGLSTVQSADTPGPVIISTSGDVKLESGTQILVHVLSVESPAK
jgi:hypothetical protein